MTSPALARSRPVVNTAAAAAAANRTAPAATSARGCWRARRASDGWRSRRRRERVGRAERGILVEHGLVQAPQLWTGLDPQFPDELPPDVGVRLQRLRLPPRPIQRKHLLPAQPLAQRMRRRQRGELAASSAWRPSARSASMRSSRAATRSSSTRAASSCSAGS